MFVEFMIFMCDAGFNVFFFFNNSPTDQVYTLMDLSDEVTEDVVAQMRAVDGVIKVRVVK